VNEVADRRAARRVHRWVGFSFYALSLIVFRDVLFAIPEVLAGQAVINGDELVPFFNPTTQLFDQARGEFSPLTNGYEFRVRYSFLTTWLRHYQVLPFAILLVLPTVFFGVYIAVSRFISTVFRNLSPVSVALGAAFPTALVYSIVTYAKITHFYTLIVGLALMTIAVLLLLYGLLFAEGRWVRYLVGASLVTLINPAVHYVVLFGVFFAVAAVTLACGELARWIRRGGPRRLCTMPTRTWATMRSGRRLRAAVAGNVLGRAVVAGLLFVVVTLIPYALFVKFIALRGVENLSVTVPSDYYFIRDASVSWLHVLSWDLAGIMDKILFGDYLAKVPRYPNVVYSLLAAAPLVLSPVRRTLLATRPHRQLFGVAYVTAAFAVWATIGYAEPQWFPTFHRSMASLARVTAQSPVGDLALGATSTVVQVLRFPHRFQLLLFVLAPVLMTLGLAWAIDRLHRRWMARQHRAPSRRSTLALRGAATVWIAAIFFIPFWSNAPYRQVFGSGNFGHFASPIPTDDLGELKAELLALPEGKTVVLPPTETAKVVTDGNGVDHRFNDKFFIYYLDQPSFYYGLTGEADNKFEFFLILRGIYYQQDWWINPARDIGIRYLIVNNRLRDNRGVGAEYLPDVESYTAPALERQVDNGFVELRFANDSYRLYELVDGPPDDRHTLLVDSSWSEYLDLVFDRLALSRCYDFEYLPYYEPTASAGSVHLYTTDPRSAALDMRALDGAFFRPTSRGFAFNSDIVTSAYYQSPVFRLFLFLSNTKWNRTEIITPGLFGTLRGGFVAAPRPTRVIVPVSLPEAGRYRLLLRGAATANTIEVAAPTLGFDGAIELRSDPESLQFFTTDTVYTPDRVAVDTAAMSVPELEDRIGDDLVPVNVRYAYHDLGWVEGAAGLHNVTIAKTDDNPILLEGLVLVPAADHGSPALPAHVEVVTDPAQLSCGDRYEVFDSRDVDYIDPTANAEHRNLSNEELLSLAAAGVPGLEPEDGGGLRYDWVVLALTAGLLVAATLTVRSHTRPRADEEDDDA
jgi:hypothetical protein